MWFRGRSLRNRSAKKHNLYKHFQCKTGLLREQAVSSVKSPANHVCNHQNCILIKGSDSVWIKIFNPKPILGYLYNFLLNIHIPQVFLRAMSWALVQVLKKQQRIKQHLFHHQRYYSGETLNKARGINT